MKLVQLQLLESNKLRIILPIKVRSEMKKSIADILKDEEEQKKISHLQKLIRLHHLSVQVTPFHPLDTVWTSSTQIELQIEFAISNTC